jgi:hypothetical protein
VEFYNRCRDVRVAVRKCLKSYGREDAYRRALKGVYRGLTDLLGDRGIRDKIRGGLGVEQGFRRA